MTRVLHTARISNVEIVLHDERMRGGESSNHVCKSSAKIIPVQNNFLNKHIFLNIFFQESWGMPTIYTHHSARNLVHKHKTIEFGVVRERPATKYI